MSRLSLPLLVVAGLLGVSAVGGVVSCGDLTSNSAVASITGVLVRAETLTANKGCGRDPSQVFKVAAVAYGKNDATGELSVPIASNSYDCFTDVTFVDLPASGLGNTDYRIVVFLYNGPAYEASRDIVDGASASTAAAAAAVEQALAGSASSWSTTCFVTQRRNVQSPAVCDPITAGPPEVEGDAGSTAGPATIELRTDTFATADGGVLHCAATFDAGTTAPDDAGIDADVDATVPSDAGDAAAPSAPLFDTVRVRWRSEQAFGPIVDVACPAPFTLPDAAPAPGTFTLDVGLLRSGTPLGQTTCTAAAIPGKTTSAVCADLP